MSQRRLLVHLGGAVSCGLLGLDEAPPGGGEVGEGAARGRVGGRRVPAELGRVAARRARRQLQEGRTIGQVDSYLSETILLPAIFRQANSSKIAATLDFELSLLP